MFASLHVRTNHGDRPRIPAVACVCAVLLAWCGDARAASGAEPAVTTHALPDGVLHAVSNDTRTSAGSGEKLLYDNPLGDFVGGISTDALLSDDIQLTTHGVCKLTRYRFQVVGKANRHACGGVGESCGPVRIDFGLFDECPNAGGEPIQGTAGCVATDLQAHPECLGMPSELEVTEIDFLLDGGAGVRAPSSVWLGVRADRAYAGVVMGAPALHGFSEDVVDTLGFPCNASSGGFPAHPHASFNASVYGDAACPDACLVYQNTCSGQSGINAGAVNCIADDLELSDTCRLVEMEVAVRGSGFYDIELRRNLGGLPEGVCSGGSSSMNTFAIPGTFKRFLVTTSGLNVRRFQLYPPIELPSRDLFAVLVPNNINATWILTGRNAAVGATLETYYAWDGDTWRPEYPLTNVHGGMQITLRCEGACPLGACCDHYLRDENDDAVCRDVSEINCPWPSTGSGLRPAWAEGVSCYVCQGGDRDGEPCRADEDCGPDAACVDNDPFLFPCGYGSCCYPDRTCEDVPVHECYVRRLRDWRLGVSCEDRPCDLPACVDAEGDCYTPNESVCDGGPDDGQTCFHDADCTSTSDGVCVVRRPQCFGGESVGQSCRSDLDCIPGGLCVDSVCDGGARDATPCDGLRDCREARCPVFPGCSDAGCCTAVCLYSPGSPRFTDFCCDVQWDAQCAELARRICDLEPLCRPGEIFADDPPHGVIDAGWKSPSCKPLDELLGIDELRVFGPPGNAAADCWTLCESDLYFERNEITEIHEERPGSYVIRLARPITPGGCTSIIYNELGAEPSAQTYRSLPGDVDGNGVANPTDILAMIDMLNGVVDPPWGHYSTDVDRSGTSNLTDVLAVIDALTGAAGCQPSNNVSLPEDCGPCPVP